MTEKEMIEDIAKKLKRYCIRAKCRAESCRKCRARWFIRNGYRKIPEGAVVLTKDEWEKYQITQRDWNAIYYDGIDQARKETAREIADKVKMAFYYEFDELIPSIMADKIDKIAEEFGVEVG